MNAGLAPSGGRARLVFWEALPADLLTLAGMPRGSRRLLLPSLGLVLGLVALLTGCSGSSDNGASRPPGDHITATEATVLANLLHENFEKGGADFIVKAPYGEDATLTMTGSVDFLSSTGQAKAVTSYTNGQPPESRTVFFTTKDIWFGDVPGLSEALAGRGLPAAQYVERPLAPVASNGSAQLVDYLARLVLNLSSRSSDDPKSFQQGNYVWQGERNVDGHLANDYTLAGGATVSVPSDKLMLQYVTRPAGQDFDITITLPEHGRRTITLPSAGQTLDASQHPDVAEAVGV